MKNDLIIDNHLIKRDIKEILTKLKSSIYNGKLKSILYKGDEVQVTCPFHKDGQETRPSCFIYVGEGDLIWGTFHCFTCGEKGSLTKFVAECFEKNERYAKDWLKKNFTEEIVEEYSIVELDEPIKLNKKEEPVKCIDESILDNFKSWHPYMNERKLTKETCERFKIKYDDKTKSIVFPVYDVNDRLIFLTRRRVDYKQFIIDKGVDKNIYLLNEVLKGNYNQVIVCESQINALLCWQWGYPAIALFGAGTTKEQMDILNKTSILHYILMYDNDPAGRKGAKRFTKYIKNTCLVTDIILPKDKDVGDLSEKEFKNLLIS